ncbi:hypothetical protein ACSHWO_02530 [Streptomyces sp. HUAS TT3]|uniref:hypothetical protein n=1 Tax=Streptomyces sp. HUAS TT3 TaxID=3447510 RepID=UPI003F65929B
MAASPRARAPRRLAALALGTGVLLAAPVAPASCWPRPWPRRSLPPTRPAPRGPSPRWPAVNLHAGTSINPTTGLIFGVVRSTGTRLV